MSLIWPLPFQVFRSFLRQRTESLFDFNNNRQDPVKLSTFCFYFPPQNLQSLTSSNIDSLLYLLRYLILSLSAISVCPCQSLWSVCESRYISWCSGCKYVPSRKARFVDYLPCTSISGWFSCVPLSGSFQCSTMFPRHAPRLWDAPLSLSLLLHGGL